MVKIVHCKKSPHDVYIGRSNDKFHFGNLFSHLETSKALIKVETRDQAIKFFEEWLLGENWKTVEQERRHWILNNLHTLKDKTLGCWCTPKACHGEVLKKMVESHGSQEKV